MELNYHFNTETFRAAWEEWKTYRKDIRKKPVKQEQRALNHLYKESRQDERTALFMMEYSMDNDYQGLFYRNPNVGENQSTAPTQIPISKAQTIFTELQKAQQLNERFS